MKKHDKLFFKYSSGGIKLKLAVMSKLKLIDIENINIVDYTGQSTYYISKVHNMQIRLFSSDGKFYFVFANGVNFFGNFQQGLVICLE